MKRLKEQFISNLIYNQIFRNTQDKKYRLE